MFGRGFTLAGAGLAALALMGGSTLSAHAAGSSGTVISDVIVFEGHATITSDSDGDNPPAVDLRGGSGTYSFTGTGACFSDGDPVLPLEVGTCSITSSGNFTNTACGTGSVTGGTATVTASNGETGTVTYGITFVATIGLLTGTWNSTGSPDDPLATDSEPIDGVVLIAAPVQVPQVLDVGDCTDAFTVIGVGAALENSTS